MPISHEIVPQGHTRLHIEGKVNTTLIFNLGDDIFSIPQRKTVTIHNDGKKTLHIGTGPTVSGPWVRIMSLRSKRIAEVKNGSIYLKPEYENKDKLDFWITTRVN
jgi:hypothetical protein